MNIPDPELNTFYEYELYKSCLQRVAMEWDTLVILPQYKLIINIEVKRGSNLGKLKDAATQTKQHNNIFQKVFGSSISNDWKFLRGACMPNLEIPAAEISPCKYCKKFILHKYNNLIDMDSWILDIIETVDQVKSKYYLADYKVITDGLIGFMSLRKVDFVNKLLIDPIEHSYQTAKYLVANESTITGENDNIRLAEKVETKFRNTKKDASKKEVIDFVHNELKKENILSYMLNLEQLEAVLHPSKTLFISGDYGTGKTYVLKERAKRYAKMNPNKKIAYVNLTSFPYNGLVQNINKVQNISTMDIIASSNFEEYQNISVITNIDWYHHFQKHKKLNSLLF